MIREYVEGDEAAVQDLLFNLQEYIIAAEGGGFLKHFDDDGKAYTQNLLKMVQDQNGKIFVCEIDGQVIGLVAGYVDELDKYDELMSTIKKPGYIAELFVSEEFRGKGYAGLLMQAIEKHLAQCDCDVITLTVDAFNSGARQMYAKTGYKENDILLIKKV